MVQKVSAGLSLSLRCRVGTGCPKNGTITPQGVGKKNLKFAEIGRKPIDKE